nr:ARID DNA-binding domain-containing protein [Tanacetum cinerariifolium]
MTVESHGNISGEKPLQRTIKDLKIDVPATGVHDPANQERFNQYLKEKYNGGLHTKDAGGSSKMSEAAYAVAETVTQGKWGKESQSFSKQILGASACRGLQFTSGGTENTQASLAKEILTWESRHLLQGLRASWYLISMTDYLKAAKEEEKTNLNKFSSTQADEKKGKNVMDMEENVKWYQSQRFKPWEKPIRNHLEDYEMRYSLKNETTDIVPKSSQRKKLSHEGKTMLKENLKESEAFNSSSVCATFKRKNARTATRKEKKARWFVCKKRGHVFWKCPSKKNKNRGEDVYKTARPLYDESLKYPERDNFRMLDIEEDERKFIFSYGVGEVSVETKDGTLVIPNVYYTLKITLNVLSMEKLENQGYVVSYERNKCGLRYMFDDEERTMDAQGDSEMIYENSESMIAKHNQFLDEYFQSIDAGEECSLIKGIEELKMDKEKDQDYIDDDYLSMNGTLYAMKVNTFPRFISFLDLIKIDKLVYNNWEVLGKKFMEMLEWFYLRYLGQDVLGDLPPVIGVIKVDSLGLYKFVDDLGGYMSVSLNNKWNEIAKLLGLAQENQEAVKECYKEYIGMVKVYYEEAQRSKHGRPKENVVDTSSGTAWEREPQAFAGMRNVEIVDMPEDGTPKGTAQVDVKDESNSEGTTNKDLEDYTSSSDDFIFGKMASQTRYSVVDDETSQGLKDGIARIMREELGKLRNEMRTMVMTDNNGTVVRKGLQNIPKFGAEDVKGWLVQIEQFFEDNNIPDVSKDDNVLMSCEENVESKEFVANDSSEVIDNGIDTEVLDEVCKDDVEVEGNQSKDSKKDAENKKCLLISNDIVKGGKGSKESNDWNKGILEVVWKPMVKMRMNGITMSGNYCMYGIRKEGEENMAYFVSKTTLASKDLSIKKIKSCWVVSDNHCKGSEVTNGTKIKDDTLGDKEDCILESQDKKVDNDVKEIRKRSCLSNLIFGDDDMNLSFHQNINSDCVIMGVNEFVGGANRSERNLVLRSNSRFLADEYERNIFEVKDKRATGEKVHTLKGRKMQATCVTLDGSDVVLVSVDCTITRWKGDDLVYYFEGTSNASSQPNTFMCTRHMIIIVQYLQPKRNIHVQVLTFGNSLPEINTLRRVQLIHRIVKIYMGVLSSAGGAEFLL